MPLGWVAAAGIVGSVATGAMQAGAASDAANAQAQSSANAQAISQQQYQDTVNRNAPFTQSGYGALSALDWGLGISPQTAGPVGASPTGYNPAASGPGGSISQAITNPGGNSNPGGLGAASGHDMRGQPTMTGTQGMPSGGMGPIGGSGLPVGGTGGTAPAGQTGGLGYGSLTTPFTTQNWQQLSPAYNFQKQQGLQGVLNSSAAGSGSMSGAALKDLTDYNQAEANTSFNNAFNQYQTQQGNIFSRLSGIAQLGESSANNTGQQGTALAGQAAQSATNIGTAQAGGIVGSANALSGGINSALPWLTAGGGGGTSFDDSWIRNQNNNLVIPQG
jgi:hypothetical protein